MYICKYCRLEFDNKQKLGGHTTKCRLNPNYEKNKKQLEEARKNICKENKHLHCQYCNKEVANEGCLSLHEKRCLKNPNRLISKTQHIKDLRNLRRDENGNIIIKLPHKISNKGRINMSKSAKERCKKYPYTCGWKGKISKPCEYLKQYLRNKGINFIEEYIPLDNRFFSLDIAWPDEKIAIEVNGNQHYDSNGNLKEYYQKRHDLLELNGWKIFEIHYSKCYNINIDDFNDILQLPIYNKEYVKEKYLTLQYKKEQKEQENLLKQHQKYQEYNKRKQIIKNLINNSGIDFSKYGWSTKAKQYLERRNELFNKGILRTIKKYCPDFLENKNVFIRN